jgi:hypothetical protein
MSRPIPSGTISVSGGVVFCVFQSVVTIGLFATMLPAEAYVAARFFRQVRAHFNSFGQWLHVLDWHDRFPDLSFPQIPYSLGSARWSHPYGMCRSCGLGSLRRLVKGPYRLQLSYRHTLYPPHTGERFSSLRDELHSRSPLLVHP